jgi:uncharacterized protein (AIM24 family)
MNSTKSQGKPMKKNKPQKKKNGGHENSTKVSDYQDTTSQNPNIYDDVANSATIVGSEGSHYIKFRMKHGHTIITALSSVIYMSDGINGGLSWGVKGVGQGIMNLLSGETVYYQKYTAQRNGAIISIGSNFIDSIIKIKIPRNQQFRLSRNCFLASTDNIKITGVVQWSGLLGIGQEEGFILPVAFCESGDYGYIWLSAYGTHEILDIPANQYIIVDNGMFLVCNNNISYSIERFEKSWTSTLLGGEGFGMKFTGPCRITVQSKNINQFYANVNSNTMSGTESKSTTQEVSKGFFGWLFGN